MSKKRPQFVTGPSDSSLGNEQGFRKRIDRIDRQENLSTPRFVERSPLIPDKIAKVAIFNSSGEKTDPQHSLNILNSGLIHTDCESIELIGNSRHQFTADRAEQGCLANSSSMTVSDLRDEKANRIITHSVAEETNIPSKGRKTTTKFLIRSKTKITLPQKKRSKGDARSKVSYSQNKETSTESFVLSNATTQTDHRSSFCRKCLQENMIKTTVGPGSLENKHESRKSSKRQDNSNQQITMPNAFCTAVNVNLSGSNTSYGIEPIISSSSVDILKSKRSPNRQTFAKNEMIHQELMNLKKSAEKSGSQDNFVSVNNTALLKTKRKTTDLCWEIKKANKNGSLRYILSALIFGILLFWLISAVVHFDFIPEIFRTIGRYLTSIPIFITRRKKEMSKTELAFKYVGSLAKGLRTIIIGTPNPAGRH